MVNHLLSILVAGTVGFLAGHFITIGSESGSDDPISQKEAVTGEEEPAAAAVLIPLDRSGSRALPSPKSADKNHDAFATMCVPGVSLQEQLNNLSPRALRESCRAAEDGWNKKHLDSFASFPQGEVEQARARVGLAEALKGPLLQSTHWLGQGAIQLGQDVIQVEILLNWYQSDDPKSKQDRTGMVLNDPRELCYTFSPQFLLNGRTSDGASSMSSCGVKLRKRDETYYLQWDGVNSRDLNGLIGMVLIPVPGGIGGLQYLTTGKSDWSALDEFRWTASTPQEFDTLRDRYRKKLEERPR